MHVHFTVSIGWVNWDVMSYLALYRMRMHLPQILWSSYPQKGFSVPGDEWYQPTPQQTGCSAASEKPALISCTRQRGSPRMFYIMWRWQSSTDHVMTTEDLILNSWDSALGQQVCTRRGRKPCHWRHHKVDIKFSLMLLSPCRMCLLVLFVYYGHNA